MHFIALHAVLLTVAADVAPPLAPLDAGYNQMYDLQFGDAHKTFSEYQRVKPDDPLVPVSDAAAYLFQEFDRLHILQSEFFVDDNNFRRPKKVTPDPQVRRDFDAQLAQGSKLAAAALNRAPQDSNALFATILILGLRADFDGLIEKKYFASLNAVKAGRATAEKLLAIDPSCYDAHLAVGVENYVLSLKAAPLRWFLQIGGAETDRNRGLESLRLTAEKGHYLKPYARLLLAVAALRDDDRKQAREILSGLARQFPHNRLYAEELARLK